MSGVARFPHLFLEGADEEYPLGAGLDRPFVVGRADNADLRLADPGCSRRQFQLSLQDGRWQIEALSPNIATSVNGRLIDSAVVLCHGDSIECGATCLRFIEKADAKAQASAAAAGPRVRFPSRPAPAAPSPPPDHREVPETGGVPPAGSSNGPAPPTGSAGTVFFDFQSMGGAGPPVDEIWVDRDKVLGRNPEAADIVLPHPAVSRRHAELQLSRDGLAIRDLGSSNRTFVNGSEVTGLRELAEGDRIDVGPYSFTVHGRALVQSSREGNLRIVARNLSRWVTSHTDGKSIKILDDLSLVIEPREFVCILGGSGSGKSTLMHALSARTRADEGQVLLNGADLYREFQALQKSIALVPQQDVLHESLCLDQALTYTARLRLPPDTTSGDCSATVSSTIGKVDLAHRAGTQIGNLSGGQKKRASLANEIISRPNLLFLDEVTSGLDEGTDWEMMKLFRKMADDGMTVICVTHTTANVESACQKIVIMAHPGVLAFYGAPAEARQYFGVERIGEIYRRMAEEPQANWQERYLQSPYYRRYIAEPLDREPAPARSEGSGTQSSSLASALPEVVRQFGILTARYAKLLLADQRTLATAAAQSILVGVLLALTFGTVDAQNPKQIALGFFLGIASFWYGCNNAAKEIVKEHTIYRLERDVNLSIPAYVLSKFVLLSIMTVIQVVVLFFVVAKLGGLPGEAVNHLQVMATAAVSGTALGLLLSAVSHSADQAATLVPIALIPQILLSGVIVPDLPKAIDYLAHVAISAFWVQRGMSGALAGVQHDRTQGITILAVHAAVFLIAAISTLIVRDRRGSV